MKTLLSFYHVTGQPIKLLPVSAFLLFSVGLKAQNKTEYKIAVYEKNRRLDINALDAKYKYEIRNLFRRVDSGWVINDEHENDSYRIVYKGKEFDFIKGRCCNEGNIGYWSEKENAYKTEIMLKPHPKIVLKMKFLSNQFNDHDLVLIKEACFLSNNPSFCQSQKMLPFTPTITEQIKLRDTTKAIFKKLFLSNHKFAALYSTYIDSIMNQLAGHPEYILIDSLNSFIDDSGNKLVTVLFTSGYLLLGIYPFSTDCFREDNFVKYGRLLFYLGKNGTISFLRNELQYLDRGDFDGDGKDEYLFWYSRFNYEGYIMYYDDFKKKIEYRWSYH